MGIRREAVVTPIEPTTLTKALTSAYRVRFGREPKRESIAMLMAQSALETGRWKSNRCFNLGNVKAGSSWTGDYCYYYASELVSESDADRAFSLRKSRSDGGAGHNVSIARLESGNWDVRLYPDHPWCKFRAFSSLEEGSAAYLDLLADRFSTAWKKVEEGDPEGFVRALHASGYFTANLEKYLKEVLSLFREYVPSPEGEHAEGGRSSFTAGLAGRPDLRPVASNPYVAELQRLLRENGYGGADLATDGVFNEATRRQVEIFQAQHIDQSGKPLKVDGVVGEKTWWALLHPSGDAQRNYLPTPSVSGLTPTRKALMDLLVAEHRHDVKEVPDGTNRGPRIDQYWGNSGLIGQPWCCAFVSWALFQTLQSYPIGGIHHTGVQRMWVTAREQHQTTLEPKPGDIFVQLFRGGQGHTGFVVCVSADGKTIYTCEGNAGNRLKLGRRPASTIDGFIDCLQDGQTASFSPCPDVAFETLEVSVNR